MKLSIEKKDRCTLITLHEEKLVSSVAPELKAQIVHLFNQGEKNLVLDLKETKFVDSSGLSAILVGNRLCKSVSGHFIISGLQAPVKKLIAISQLDGVLSIVPKAGEAMDLIILDEIEKEVK